MSLANGDTVIKLSELTADYLKLYYLTGLKFVDKNGKEYPDSLYDTHMMNAARKLEALCDIVVLPQTITAEEHDYHAADFMQWGFLRLYRVPVRAVYSVRAVYPAGGSTVNYPTEMIEVREDTGQINIVATQGSLSSVIVGQGGDFLPLVYGGVSTVPNLWQVDYLAGMDPEDVPRLIVEAIMKMASMDLLALFSDLVRPIGVNSESASIDGLSQSMSYQLPAFQARIKRYSEDLYGPDGKQQDLTMTSGMLKQILNKYRPINMVST
jgi:hypothetical protein